MAESENPPKKSGGSGWLSVAIDYGPLLVFLLVYRSMAPDEPNPAGELLAIMYGTGAFMVAAIIAEEGLLNARFGALVNLLITGACRQ